MNSAASSETSWVPAALHVVAPVSRQRVFDLFTALTDFSSFVFEEVHAHSVELAAEPLSIAIAPKSRIYDHFNSNRDIHF
jgi:hypothetical protein